MFRHTFLRTVLTPKPTTASNRAILPLPIKSPITRFSVVTNFNEPLPLPPSSSTIPPFVSITPTSFPHLVPSPRCRIPAPFPGSVSTDAIFVSLPARVRDHAPLGVLFKVDVEGRLSQEAEVRVGRKTIIALGGDPERKLQEVVVNGVCVLAEVGGEDMVGEKWVGRRKEGVVVDCGEWVVELRREGGGEEEGRVGVEIIWK